MVTVTGRGTWTGTGTGTVTGQAAGNLSHQSFLLHTFSYRILVRVQVSLGKVISLSLTLCLANICTTLSYMIIYIEIIIVHSNMLLAIKLAINKYAAKKASLAAINCYSNWFIGRRRWRRRRCLYYKHSRCVAAAAASALALRFTHDRKESETERERQTDRQRERAQRNWANRCDSILLRVQTHTHTQRSLQGAQLCACVCAYKALTRICSDLVLLNAELRSQVDRVDHSGTCAFLNVVRSLCCARACIFVQVKVF